MTATASAPAHAPARPQRPGDPCVMVIFGAAGDLTRRKLIPALYNLRLHGLLPRSFAVIGVARTHWTDEQFRDEMGARLAEFATTPVDPAIAAEYANRVSFVSGAIDDASLYPRLADKIREADAAHRTAGNVLFYFATPPATFAPIARGLAAAGLTVEPPGSWRRVIVEKPFGTDLESARALNKELQAVISEPQIYRIDHYLGKETVQNIMVLRFANGVLEPLWNRRYIDHIQILVAESIGIEGRGAYYDEAGTLRDMIQNHMFQLLSLVAMEPPISFSAEDVRNEKVKVLRSIRPMPPEDVLQRTVRGQYGEGMLGDARVPAYRDEPNVKPASNTETYGAVQLFVENWRWAGVPFYLRSGKRLPRRCTEIVIQFKRAPLHLFANTPLDYIGPNRLRITVQPEEGIALEIKAKVPGPAIDLKGVKLAFSYRDFGDMPPSTGYETLLYDCMIGDSTLFHRADMVEAAWAIATPILDVWRSIPARDFPNYAAGSWGPPAADELIQKDARRWIHPE